MLAKRKNLFISVFCLLAWGAIFYVICPALAEEATTTPAETSVAVDENESILKELNRQIDEQRSKIDQLAGEIEQYKTNIKNTQSQATTLKNQIYIIDNQIAKANLDIRAKEEMIKAVELEIAKIELLIKENELNIKKQKEELGSFIRALNDYDQKGLMTIVLNYDSFSDFFDQVKNLESVQRDLQSALNRLQETVAKLNSDKADLDNKRQEQSNLLNKLEGQKVVLGSQKENRQYLINETKKSEKKFQILIADLQKEQAAASSAVAGLEKRLRQVLKQKGEGEKFNALGDAVLSWPLSAPLTAYFHDPDYPYRYLFEHSGIDLGVPQGTPVRAAEAGYVAKVAFNTRWYGTYIMIIHSDNLATLYAHLSAANISSDQYVSKGQTIGASGNTGFSSGPHLHFEVRYNGIPVNPLGYLP